MAEFFETLLALSLGASLMSLLLYGLKLCLSARLSSSVYYYLWLLVLLRFVLPMPGFMPTVSEPADAVPVMTENREPQETRENIRDYTEPTIPWSYAPDNISTLPVTAEKEQEPGLPVLYDAAVSVKSADSMALLFMLWLLGALVYLARSVTAYLRFARAVRRKALSPDYPEFEAYRAMPAKKKPRLMKSPYISTPMLMGLFSPVLILPAREYSNETLNNIFLHELKHYSRHDIVYKWFAQVVLALHWFNPLTYFIRREINRACEMSCDEMLISRMDRQQRQSYGETLINLAARRPLPAGIVATSFAMEKRDLKERLSKIMKQKKTSIIAALLCLLLLAGCGTAVGPVSDKADPAPSPENIQLSAEDAPAVDGELSIYKAANVDELLDAIGPDRIIYLNTGVYDLTDAEGYAKSESEYYYWNNCYDGFELVICNTDNLHIVGVEGTEIVTRPRYANVLSFVQCSGIGLDTLIIGHSPEEGFCTGGVVQLDSCADVDITGCSLYGCGTVGIFAENCENVHALGCEIYDCSNYGVDAISCKNVIIEESTFHSNRDGFFQSVFCANNCVGFTVLNCEIYDNEAQSLLQSRYSQQVSMLGCNSRDNIFETAIIHAMGYSPVIDKCSLADLDRFLLYALLPAVDTEGNELTRDKLEAMVQSEASFEGLDELPPVELNEMLSENGRREVTVTTVDEFLAAIDDDTTIKLDAELFDLSTASDYGAYGGDNYYWIDIFDGPGLVINGVKNLSIVSENDCTISAIPRYANVLSFVNCESIVLSGFTAGHTEEPGSCAGGVLDFQDCWGIGIDNCRLYGCGILGISAKACSELRVQDTEIYDCSQGAISLGNIFDASFDGMNIHDCHTPEISIYESMDISFEGEELAPGVYKLENGKAAEFYFEPVNG